MDLHLTIFELLAHFCDMVHSQYAITSFFYL